MRRLMTMNNLISIHAPHAGSDGHGFEFRMAHYLFQSTPPMRGATSELVHLLR